MKKHNYNTLGAIVAAVICNPIKLGIYDLSDNFLYGLEELTDGMINAICSLLSIIISVAITLVIIRIQQKVGKSKQ